MVCCGKGMVLWSGVYGVYYECTICQTQIDAIDAQRRARQNIQRLAQTVDEVSEAVEVTRRVQTPRYARRGELARDRQDGWHRWWPRGGQRSIDILYAFAMALGFLDDTTQRAMLLEFE